VAGMDERTLVAVIAEDEAVLREELQAHLESLWPELEVRAAVADGHAALAALAAHRPQVLFLDIQMPGLSGIEVARMVRDRCHVVFVTAHDEFAVAAFEQGAIDYVMKPFSTERLTLAIERLKSRLASRPANLDGLLERLSRELPRPRAFLRWINASQGSELRFITVDEICYFRSDTKYTRVVTPHQESLIRKPVRELISELDPNVFWQIHRSVIVNLSEIAGVQRDMRGRIQLRLKRRPESLPVSQPYNHLFHQM
jgi:DNA-binding LytR/AlgR family response regulator